MVKVVSLSDEAYRKLSLVKRNLSFSQIVIELVDGKKKKSLRELAGKLSETEAKEFKEDVVRNRKKSKVREVNF